MTPIPRSKAYQAGYVALSGAANPMSLHSQARRHESVQRERDAVGSGGGGDERHDRRGTRSDAENVSNLCLYKLAGFGLSRHSLAVEAAGKSQKDLELLA